MCPSPNNDVQHNEGLRLVFCFQSSGVTRVAHQPACFIAWDTSFLHVEWCNGFSMFSYICSYHVLYVPIDQHGLSM